MSDFNDLAINGAARAAIRAAISRHPDWLSYKRLAGGRLVAQYTKDDLISACNALHIDIRAIIAATADTTSTDGDRAMKERTRDRNEINRLRNRFDDVSNRLTAPDREKAEGIFQSVQKYGSGCGTEAQYKAIEKIVAVGEMLPPVTETATAAAPAPVSSTPAAPANPAASNALYDIMRDAVRADLEPLVRGIVTRALDGVQTVKIELTRQGETAGTAEGHQHPMFAILCRALAARQADGFCPNVWINGPTGSGKSHAVKQFATAAGQSYHFQGASMMPHEVLGFIDANGTYHRTSFREAFEHGGLFCFDEADAWANEALLPLNAGTANGRLQFPDAMIERHKDCRIVATANTFGLGGVDYVGRAKLDAAFLSRFPVKLMWTYDTALEVAISGNADFARRVQGARERAKGAGLKVLIDPRASIAGAALIAQGFTHDEAAQMTYLANLSPEQVKQVEGRSI